MNRLILEAEYADVIVELLGERYHVQSLIKIVFISFCVKNEKRISYGRRKRDILETFLRNISIKLLSHPDEVIAILEVINKMKTSGMISVNNDVITVNKLPDGFKCENDFLIGCRNKAINPIVEVNKLDARAFTEEVLRHV